jgi:hypothetical protein
LRNIKVAKTKVRSVENPQDREVLEALGIIGRLQSDDIFS